MKNQLLHIGGALLFSTLFYGQYFGLNMLIFAILAIVIVYIRRRLEFARWDMRIAALVYLTTAVFVFTNNSILSQVNYFIAFIVFTGSISGIQNSVYVQGFNGAYQSFLGSLHQYLSKNTIDHKEDSKKNSFDYRFVLLCTVVAAILVVIFSLLYSKANPIFESWIKAIDLSFINTSWLFCAFLGYILLRNITSTAELDILTKPERKSSQQLSPKPLSEDHHKSLQKESTFGIVILGALNILILLFLTVDFWYILNNPLGEAAALSKAVHEGVNALVCSIIIAIVLILILFRGDLNFYKKSDSLRKLTYFWIVLNITLILITAYKNYLYSSGFGLTYKRIGVCIYLTLCLSGMITTYVKVARKKNLHFMIRSNARVAFLVLILLSSFSWDRTITHYNLQQLSQPDFKYLLSMSYRNGDLLHAFAKANPGKAMDRNRIDERHQEWLYQMHIETWQSATLNGFLNTQAYENNENDYTFDQ